MKRRTFNVCSWAIPILVASLSSGQVAGKEKIAKGAEARVWSSASGKFTVKAKLLKLVDGDVHLEKADGVTTTVPLEKLGSKDKDYVTKFFADLEAGPPWEILEFGKPGLVKEAGSGKDLLSGTFTIGGNFFQIVIRCKYSPKKDAAETFKLRTGEDGEFIGKLNNSSVRGKKITMLFEAVSAEPEELYLCDDKGNQVALDPGYPARRALAKSLVNRMLKDQDEDRDGGISKDEYYKVESKSFKGMDADTNGSIDLTEYRELFSGDKSVPEEKIMEDFSLLDEDASGMISFEEFDRKSFERKDLNGDGTLDREELAKYLK